jgi:hypothetical protein
VELLLLVPLPLELDALLLELLAPAPPSMTLVPPQAAVVSANKRKMRGFMAASYPLSRMGRVAMTDIERCRC